MAGNTPTDPFELLQISKDWLSAQQKVTPSGRIFEQAAEAVRAVTQANIAYGQALMRANAAFMAALMERPLKAENEAGEGKPPA